MWLWRCSTAKGEKEDALAPAPVEFAYDATGVTITFDHVGAGLKLAQGEELLGFELIKDAVATPASARLTGVNTVRVGRRGKSARGALRLLPGGIPVHCKSGGRRRAALPHLCRRKRS